MRVLHVFGRMALGGAEKRTVAVLDHLPAGVRCDVAVLSGKPGPLDDAVRAAGGEVYPCALGPGFPARFVRLLRRTRPDVVHAHVHWVSGAIVTLARIARVPGRIVHFRSTGDGRAPSRRRRARDGVLRALADANATAVRAVGEGVLAATWGPDWATDPRCAPLYAGVDLAPYAAPPPRHEVRATLEVPLDVPIVAHVGNMRMAKNHPRIARVFAALAARSPAHLVLAGHRDPTVEAGIRRTLTGLDDRVHVLGVRDDVPALLAAADAFLFPSVYEGLPGSVLEARAARLPVVASDLPGVHEIARRVDGLRVLSLDAPDADWVDALEAALAEGPLSAGALDGTCFDSRTSAQAHLDAWNAALAALGKAPVGPMRDRSFPCPASSFCRSARSGLPRRNVRESLLHGVEELSRTFLGR